MSEVFDNIDIKKQADAQTVQKPVKPKRVMTDERKEQLREQLARGRETMKKNREARAKAKQAVDSTQSTENVIIDSDYEQSSDANTSGEEVKVPVEKSELENLKLENDALKSKLKSRRSNQKTGAVTRYHAAKKAQHAAAPPVAKPPAAKPPAAEPPVAKPPAAEPPVAKPPVAKPPVAKPPIAAYVKPVIVKPRKFNFRKNI